MPIGWDDYLKVSNTSGKYFECRQRCRTRFEQFRKNIQCAVEATKPQVIACLGAGVLNDIPLESMVQSGATVHLVDWIPGSIDVGIDLSIIHTNENSKPCCIYCSPAIDCPDSYCSSYKQASPTSTVCRSFVPVSEPQLRCGSFVRGEQPSVHYEDITSGFATTFGQEILSELDGIRTWKQAFTRAESLANRMSHHKTCTPIADSSVDLVTSSMVMSQFDHEPYGYFAHRAADLLGPPSASEEKRLLPIMNSLRRMLLVNQVTPHCEEITRMLAPDGYCYMSFEIFHEELASRQWFIVDGMPRALEIIGDYFLFNFDILPHHEPMTRFQTDNTPSLVFSFMLSAKQAGGGVKS